MEQLSDKGGRHIKKANVLNFALLLILILVLVFGWFYLKKMSPVDVVRANVPTLTNEPPVPEFLYSITGNLNDALNSPNFAFVFNRTIYVSDTEHDRILMCNYDGQPIGSFGKGKVLKPVGIAAYDNKLYIASPEAKYIFIYSLDGKELGKFAPKKVFRPVNIFVKNNKFYVTDIADMAVRVFDPTGNLLLAFGGKGETPGKLYYPNGIYVDDQEQIWVMDSNNSRVQVFDQKGKVQKVMDGKSGASFFFSRGLAFDKNGFMYSASFLGNLISISNAEGKRVGEIRDVNSTDKVSVPTNVFIDAEQRLYVPEVGKNRVLVFDVK